MSNTKINTLITFAADRIIFTPLEAKNLAGRIRDGSTNPAVIRLRNFINESKVTPRILLNIGRDEARELLGALE